MEIKPKMNVFNQKKKAEQAGQNMQQQIQARIDAFEQNMHDTVKPVVEEQVRQRLEELTTRVQKIEESLTDDYETPL